MPDLQPLLSRIRYDDEEWELASAGRCARLIPWPPGIGTWCGEPSDPDSFYRWCAEHDQEAREVNPYGYGI